MAELQKSSRENVNSPPGNSLALFVDGITGELLLKDSNGIIDFLSNYVSAGGQVVRFSGGTGITVTTSSEGNVVSIELKDAITPTTVVCSEIISTYAYVESIYALGLSNFSDINITNQLEGATAKFSGVVRASNLSGVNTGDQDLAPYQLGNEKAVASGYASLDENGKVPLVQINDALLGNVSYQGLWNAATNSPNLTAIRPKGQYFITSDAGTKFGTSFEVGDWIISNGTSYDRVDNTDAVSSVAGLTGPISAINLKSALSLNLVNNTADASKPISTATALALASKEATSNKVSVIGGQETSVVQYPNNKALVDWTTPNAVANRFGVSATIVSVSLDPYQQDFFLLSRFDGLGNWVGARKTSYLSLINSLANTLERKRFRYIDNNFISSTGLFTETVIWKVPIPKNSIYGTVQLGIRALIRRTSTGASEYSMYISQSETVMGNNRIAYLNGASFVSVPFIRTFTINADDGRITGVSPDASIQSDDLGTAQGFVSNSYYDTSVNQWLWITATPTEPGVVIGTRQLVVKEL